MLTIKWTQQSGCLNIIPTKSVAVVRPKTEAWNEQLEADKSMITDDMRALVHYDGGTICVFRHDLHLYIVNDNGKTVETV